MNHYQSIKVNLINVKKNYLRIQSLLKLEKTICSAVVKANAYGLGLREVTNTLCQVGCKDFWVTNLEEAYIIKKISPISRIYIFQGVNNLNELKTIQQNNFIPVISSQEMLGIINYYLSYKINVVLNFDTGIGRDGMQIEEIKNLNLQNCNILYVMSHLSCSQQVNHLLNKEQLTNILNIKKMFPTSKFTLANSGGIFLGARYHFSMVRPGGALYGIESSEYQKSKMFNVIEFYSNVLIRKIFYKSQNVGYNATYTVQKGDKVFIIATGYFYGYKRILGNQSFVYTKGYFLPVIGTISMNMIVVNANQLPELLFNTTKFVELIGNNISLKKVAKLAGTDQREILTGITTHCKKIYIY